MPNNFFTFTRPYYTQKYGEDWADFDTIVDDTTDYTFEKVWQLYWLNDPNYFTTRICEIVLESLGIQYELTDTLKSKKLAIRKFLTQFKNKGISEVYLDIQESIVGTRGDVYTGLDAGVTRWNASRWGVTGNVGTWARKWSTSTTPFYIYIDCKTVDNGELDQIMYEFRKSHLLPAFYQIYLTDSSLTILRTV